MLKFKKIFLVILLVTMVFNLSGCSSSDSNSGTQVELLQISGPEKITVPASGYTEATYTAELYDSNGRQVEREVEWLSVEKSGVSLSQKGVLQVSEMAESGELRVGAVLKSRSEIYDELQVFLEIDDQIQEGFNQSFEEIETSLSAFENEKGQLEVISDFDLKTESEDGDYQIRWNAEQHPALEISEAGDRAIVKNVEEATVGELKAELIYQGTLPQDDHNYNSSATYEITVIPLMVNLSGEVTVDYNYSYSSSIFSAAQSLSRSTQSPAAGRIEKKENEYIISFAEDLDSSKRRSLIADLGAKLIREIPELEAALVKIEEEKVYNSVLIQAENGIENIEPNYMAYAQNAVVPNDQYFSEQWNYQMIDLPYAWNYEKDSNLTVAVLDTGIKSDHPDLQGRIISGHNFIADSLNTEDDQGHGTHVAGIIAAQTDNNQGIAGVSWAGEILAVKVLNSSGGGSYDAIAEGILYAAGLSEEYPNENPADIINLSLGGSSDADILRNAVQKAAEAGVIIVAASGNSNSSLLYPAAYPETIAVGAVAEDGERADYSNYGPALDIVAPGGSSLEPVLSTSHDGQYVGMEGTSMATPHVSAVISLMINKGIPAPQVRDILKESSIHPGSSDFSDEYGYGLLNANFALNGKRKLKLAAVKKDGTVERIIRETTLSLTGGAYQLELPLGEYYLSAWVDVNDNNTIDPEDYVVETEELNFSAEGDYQQNIELILD